MQSCLVIAVVVSAVRICSVSSMQQDYLVEQDGSWQEGDSLLNHNYSSLQRYELNDDDYIEIELGTPIKFFRNVFNYLYVSSNGLLSFTNMEIIQGASANASTTDLITQQKNGEVAVAEEKLFKSVRFVETAHDSFHVKASSETETLEHADGLSDAMRDHLHESFLVALHPHEARRERTVDLANELINRLHTDVDNTFTAKIENVLEHIGVLHIRSPSNAVKEFLTKHLHVMQIEANQLVRVAPIDRKVVDVTAPVTETVESEDSTGLNLRRRRLQNQFKGYMWGLDRIDQKNRPLDKEPYTPPPATNGGEGVDVYVLDTGLDTMHTEFSNGGRTVENVFNSYGALVANTDVHGHGTHVSGTVGGINTGVAPRANIYGVKVLHDNGFGSDATILSGMDFVLSKRLNDPVQPIVACMSLGGLCGLNCKNSLLVRMADELSERGVVVVVAAGNSNDAASYYTPAASRKAITVGSTTIKDKRSDFSNYKSFVDIFAPGSRIVSACSGRSYLCPGRDDAYASFSGTSMAAPHVAGVVALWLSQTADSYVATAAPSAAVKKAVQCRAAYNKISNLEFTSNRNILLQVPEPIFTTFEQADCDLKKSKFCKKDKDGKICSGNGRCFLGSCLCNEEWVGKKCDVPYASLFSLINTYGEPIKSIDQPPYNIIAPFWSDFNPEEGGNIYAGITKNARGKHVGAVVFEDVPFFSDPTCRITFEALFYSNGRFEIAIVKSGNNCTRDRVSVGFKGQQASGGSNEKTPFEQLQFSRKGVVTAAHYTMKSKKADLEFSKNSNLSDKIRGIKAVGYHYLLELLRNLQITN